MYWERESLNRCKFSSSNAWKKFEHWGADNPVKTLINEKIAGPDGMNLALNLYDSLRALPRKMPNACGQVLKLPLRKYPTEGFKDSGLVDILSKQRNICWFYEIMKIKRQTF